MHLDPCCWKWHSSSNQISMSSLFANRLSFFICFLRCRISFGDDRSWFAPTKAQLTKQTLTLSHTELNPIVFSKMMAKQLTIPKVMDIAKNLGCLAQSLIYFKNKGRYLCKSCWSFYSEEELKLLR